MSNAIDQYIEYRQSIQKNETPEKIADKKAQFEAAFQNCNPLEMDETEHTLIQYVIYLQDIELLTKILEKLGKFQQSSKETLMILQAVIAVKSDKVIKLLTNYGIDVDQLEFNSYGRTQLAAYSGMLNLDACIFLLHNGADITAVNTYDNSQNIFDYAFQSRPSSTEKNIQDFNRKKIQLINFLSLWACLVGYEPDLSHINFEKIDPEIIKNVFLIGAKVYGFDLHLQRQFQFNYTFATIDALLDKANTEPQFNFNELYLALKHCVDAGNDNSRLKDIFESVKQSWLAKLNSLLEKAKTDPQFNFKDFYLSLKHCVDARKDNPKLENIFERVKKTWIEKSGNNVILFTLFYHPQQIDSLPSEYKEQAKQQQIDLEIDISSSSPSSQQKM